jgi:hypothetical protein
MSKLDDIRKEMDKKVYIPEPKVERHKPEPSIEDKKNLEIGKEDRKKIMDSAVNHLERGGINNRACSDRPCVPDAYKKLPSK